MKDNVGKQMNEGTILLEARRTGGDWNLQLNGREASEAQLPVC
jgi:hypothetical protein